jgi:7-keto-8-aminopelargonate synthetase-like enzyme
LNSEVGNRLRIKVLENYHYMKKELNNRGYTIIGYPSPIMPLLIGDEFTCRIVTRLMLDEGIHCNGIEYPIVKSG